jgi:hypothetical protein
MPTAEVEEDAPITTSDGSWLSLTFANIIIIF